MKKKLSKWLMKAESEFALKCKSICLIGLILFGTGFQTSAANPQQGKLNLNASIMTYKEIFKEIQKQTGYVVMYNNADLDKEESIEVDFNNVDLDKALKEILDRKELTFQVKEDFIILEKDRSPKKIEGQQQEKKSIKGTVTDGEGVPLPGGSVVIKGTNIGVATDIDGNYSLELESDKVVLIFSFVGMLSQEVPYNGESQINVKLQFDTADLDEIIVTGYQTLSRERATGAFNVVTKKEIDKRHVTQFSEVLDGMVAGAQASDDGRGGKSFTIRGVGTMMADNTPLIVLDGFPLMDIASDGSSFNPALSALEKINPNDVENITILKDAAAASIWGARSANGVIVITTKKGAGQKKIDVNVSSQLSVSQKPSVGHLMNSATSAQTIEYEKMAFENGWISSEFYGTFNDLYNPVALSELTLYKGQWGIISQEEMNKELNRLSTLDNQNQIRDYFLKNSVVSQTNASLSYGNEKYNTNASIMYQYNEGDFIGERDNSLMTNWNNQYRFNKHLKVNVGLNFQRNNAHQSVITPSDVTGLSPYEMLFNADNSYAEQVGYVNTYVLDMYEKDELSYNNTTYNLLQEARNRRQKTRNTNYRIQLGLEANIMEGLNFNSRFQYEENRYKQYIINGEESFYVRQNVNYYTPFDYNGNVIGSPALPKGKIRQNSQGKSTGLVFRNNLSFDRVFSDKHNVSIILGNEISNYRYSSHTDPYLYGITDSSSGEVGLGGYVATMNGDSSSIPGVPAEGKQYVTEHFNNNRFVSFYGNMSYVYDDRYGVSASARSDASNLITSKPKYRWSPLWSIGALWNMGNESFMKNQKVIDRLTFRLTYGQNGNANSSSSARTTINYNSANIDESTGKYPGSISDYGNPTLRWEKTTSTNFGLDFALFKNHISGSIDLYDKKGSDILGNVAIPSASGTSSATFNTAEIQNKGIEVSLQGKVDIGKVVFTGNIVYSYNKNKVTKLYNELNTVSDMLNAQFVVGSPMSPIYTFKYTGVNENGIPMVSDGQGGGYTFDDFSTFLAPADSEVLKYIGTTVPPHTLGIRLNLTYANFDLSAHFNGRFGGKVRMPVFDYPILSTSKTHINAQIDEVLNGNTKYPPLPSSDVSPMKYMFWGFYYKSINTAYENSSYIYCKDIVLNYTFPDSLTHKLGIGGLNLFSKVENLGLIWSANPKHYHPDYLPGSLEPSLTYTFGVNINL